MLSAAELAALSPEARRAHNQARLNATADAMVAGLKAWGDKPLVERDAEESTRLA